MSGTIRSIDEAHSSLFFLGLFFLSAPAHAWFRLGVSANPVFKDDGYRRTCFTNSLSSTSATLIYSGNANDRETLFENLSDTYNVNLTTFSTIASNPPRMIVRKSGDLWTNNSGDLYAYIEATGSGVTVVGCTEFDPKDR